MFSPVGRATSAAPSPIGVTIQCWIAAGGKPPVCRGPRSSLRSWASIPRMTSQLRKGWISMPSLLGASSSAICQLPQRVPMPRIPLGPA